MKVEFRSLKTDGSDKNVYITFDNDEEWRAFAGDDFKEGHEIILDYIDGYFSVEYIGNGVAIVNKHYEVVTGEEYVKPIIQLCKERMEIIRNKEDEKELKANDPFQVIHKKGDVRCVIYNQSLNTQNLYQLSKWTEIQYLKVDNCSEPQTSIDLDLRNLTALEEIGIQYCAQVVKIDLSKCSQLTNIDIVNLKNLTFIAVPQLFPQLKKINLSHCEKLSLFNYLNAPELTSLQVYNIDTYGLALSRFPRLSKLEIYFSDRLFDNEFTISNNPEITTLTINSYAGSKQKFNINHLKHLTKLINLNLVNPEGIIDNHCLADSIQSIILTNATIGSLTFKNNDNLNELKLAHCDFTSSQTINIDCCQHISHIEMSDAYGLKNLTLKQLASLKSIMISDCHYLESIDLSECITLTSISIINCRELKTLHLSNHPNISFIEIQYCPILNGLNLNKYKNARFKIEEIGPNNKLHETNKDKLNTIDIAGFLVRNNLSPSHPDDHTAGMTILSAWRQRQRQDNTHRKLFGGKTVSKDINKQFSIPAAFKDILFEELPDILSTTKHFSNRLSTICHDGAIYSSKTTNITKLLTPNDYANDDHELVFTTPRYSYKMDYILLDIEKLFTVNNPIGTYFKLADWTASDDSIPEIHITPNIKMTTVLNLDKSFDFTISNIHTGETTIIALPGEECLYQGLYGLKEFLHFFIFKILNKIPDDHPIKKDIYHFFHHLKQINKNQLIQQLNQIANVLSTSSEIDYVNKLSLNFNMIKQLSIDGKHHDIDVWRKLIETNDIKGMQEIFQNAAIKEMVSHSYMMAKGMFDYAHQHNANEIKHFLQNEFKQILHLKEFDKISINHELLEHAQHVYKHYLKKPYTEKDQDHSYTEDNITIHRPNHGLAHTMRQTFHILEVMNYLENFAADESTKIIITTIKSNPTELLKLQIASLFLMTGRESDLGFTDDPKRYMEYRAASAKNFEQYAKSLSPPLFSAEDIQTYTYLVEHMGNPLERSKLTGKTACLYDILNMAHKLDLMRCYRPEQFHSSINTANSALIKPSNEQRNAFIDLQLMAERLIRATGDRQLTAIADKIESPHYDSTKFQIASTDPKACYVICTLGLHNASMLGNNEFRKVVKDINERITPKNAAAIQHKYTKS